MLNDHFILAWQSLAIQFKNARKEGEGHVSQMSHVRFTIAILDEMPQHDKPGIVCQQYHTNFVLCIITEADQQV